MTHAKQIPEWLSSVRRPSRYLGNEINAVKKDWATVSLKVCLAYPDAYEIGMSNIGLSILYHLLNDQPEIACERVYAPWTDMEKELRQRHLPLTSLESGVPLGDFDILGISIPYELTYTNILTLLDLAGIPFTSRERLNSGKRYPLILGGGTGAFNPEPVADFFDAILIGDGEDALLEICHVMRAGSSDRQEMLKRLASLPGVYIPSFFRPHYKEDGTIEKIEPLLEGYSSVGKRSVSDLNMSYYPKAPIVPHTKVIHDRIGIEVQRGCTRGCRFCQAGYIYRPERQRSPESVKEIVRNQVAATGQNEVSLVSLSIGDYDCLTPLLKDLMDEHGPKRVGISLPATRVEQLSPAIMEEIKRVRKTGFTIAPEAATERMRDVINKGNSEENLLTTVKAVFSHGWSLMKFYFMIGLPTETDEDVRAIGKLGQKTLHIGLQHNRHAEINLGVSPFVPKPFTPYQWFGQITLEECHRRLNLIRSELRSRRLHMKPHKPESSYLEGIFSRGDRRLGALVIAAWKKGARFDQWEECLDFTLWKSTWEELDIDPTFYVERERPRDEIFPWDHLFVEMKKDWLWDEYQESFKAAFIEDCSTGLCTKCGVCDYKEVRNRSYELPVLDEAGKVVKKRTTTEVRGYSPLLASASPHLPQRSNPIHFSYTCIFSKTGSSAFLSHLEFVDTIRRAVARAGLPIRFSQGYHPQPRISFGQGMPVGKEMFGQPLTLELEEAVEAEAIRERLNRELPEGIVIESVRSTVKPASAQAQPSPPPPSPAPSPTLAPS